MKDNIFKTDVPESMHVQLSRLFGTKSKDANLSKRTPRQWKNVLRRVLKELDSYLDENIDSDFMLLMNL